MISCTHKADIINSHDMLNASCTTEAAANKGRSKATKHTRRLMRKGKIGLMETSQQGFAETMGKARKGKFNERP